MRLFINNPADAGKLQAMIAKINEQRDSFAPHSESIPDEDKIGMRTMADGREGPVTSLLAIAKQNVNDLARDANPEDLASRLSYHDNLSDVEQACLQLLEMIKDTKFLVAADIMTYYDSYMGDLQNRRKQNGNLDEAMKKIDEYNSRFGPNGPADNPPPPPQG